MVYLEMTTKDVTPFSSMFYITNYQYDLRFTFQCTALIVYSLQMPHQCPVLQTNSNQSIAPSTILTIRSAGRDGPVWLKGVVPTMP